MEVAFLRSSRDERDAVWAGVKGGQNRSGRGHAQLDLGSFVIDAGGTRWALDFGRNEYDVPDYFGKLRFTYYRTTTASHNTLLIDDLNQNVTAEAPIFAHRFEPGFAFVRMDLDETYPDRLRHFERGVALYRDRHVIVQDEIRAIQPVSALWGMVTDAEVTLNGREATLQKGSQLLNAKILSPASARFDVLSTQAPPGETLNGNTRKLVVRLPDLVVRLPDKVESLRLVVALTPYRRDSAAPKLDWADRPLDTW